MSDRDSHLIRPPALRPGDRVHVISPAGPVVPDVLRDGLNTLRNWGLDVVVDDRVYDRRPPFDYLAGDDKTRLSALIDAWQDPDCRAIICSRGGYGSMRILADLDLEMMRSRPRLLVGFSDITALHLYLAGVGQMATLHGPVVKSLRDEPDRQTSAHRLRQALFADTDAPEPWTDLTVVRPGRVTGRVLGGNLSLIVAMLATPQAPSLKNVILVVEDITEEDYRLDRLFTALRLSAGDQLAGLVLGDFTQCHGTYVTPQQLDRYLYQLAGEFECPVVANAPVGHEAKNFAFPLGIQATLDAHQGTLRFLSHATRGSDGH